MNRARRLAKPVAALAAALLIVAVATGCAFVKPKSLSVSQPQGLGSVKVHFEICTVGGEDFCGPTEDDEVLQYLAGLAVPPGAVAPQTFTATPTKGGAPIVFTRNDQVASELAAASAGFQKGVSGLSPEEKAELEQAKEFFGGPWPPAGTQAVGYLSAPVTEVKEQVREWTVDTEFGLPVPADGNPFAGPFTTAIAWGERGVFEGGSAERPVHCFRFEEGSMIEEGDAFCVGNLQQIDAPTSDLRIAPPSKPAQAFVGGSGTVAFTLKYGSVNPTTPAFALSATTAAKGGKAKLGSSSFTPGAPAAGTHLSPNGTGKVTVTMPKSVKPGTYDVVLTAKAPQGGTVSGTGKLKVVKATLKFGATKYDAKKGTATLKVKVPGAGKVTVSGKEIKKTKKKAKKKGTVKLKVKATGSTAAVLAATGKAKVKAKVTFKPTSGVAVTKKKSLTLKLK